MRETTHEPEEEYAGPARLSPPVGDEQPLEVRVDLRGHFEPIDGLFHWYGRIARHPELDARHTSGDTVVLTTPHGSAEARISDVDTWGRFRIAGTGRPPF